MGMSYNYALLIAARILEHEGWEIYQIQKIMFGYAVWAISGEKSLSVVAPISFEHLDELMLKL